MGLGPTLVGGAIGAALGMGLHLIVEIATPYEAPWFAVVIGLLTGLGVHQANKSLAGRVSYVRGALSAAIALAAIVGSTPLISFVAQKVDRSSVQVDPIARRGDDSDDGMGASGDVEGGSEVDRQRAISGGDAGPGMRVGGGNVRPAQDFNIFQFVFMAVGTFIAYEFGRGTGGVTTTIVEDSTPANPSAGDAPPQSPPATEAQASDAAAS